jgi:hypothetical protein
MNLHQHLRLSILRGFQVSKEEWLINNKFLGIPKRFDIADF